MHNLKFYIALLATAFTTASFAQKIYTVDHFDKVIISPFIQVTFVEGNEETVTIENCNVETEKLHIEVNGKTLRIYLEGAKDVPKNEKDYSNGYTEKHALYHGTVVTAVVTYRKLNELSLRGEETQVCKSVLQGDYFRLKIYGTSKVILNEVDLNECHATIYGESTLNIKAGRIDFQHYIVYGESTINSLGISGNNSKLVAYGEADFFVNVSNEINITAFGEASLHYKGTPVIYKGIHIGDMKIDKMD